MRLLPFVRLVAVGSESISEAITWIITNTKLRGSDVALANDVPSATDTLNTPIYQLQKNIETVYDLTALSGLRADAPIVNRFTYFATDLNIPIWWNPVTEIWVDATGTGV
tara:strand:+ start:707 stop:1036 length:330 start_codon:yes stop_codon:yes gene_type:complete